MDKIYLIPIWQAERIKDVPEKFYAEAWENRNPLYDFEPSAWTTKETLEGLRAIGVEPEVLQEAEVLPVFHGLGSYIDTSSYEEALSAIASASPLGGVIKGITYVGFNCEKYIADMIMERPNQFLYYSRKEGRRFLWFLLTDDDECIRWALHELWKGDPNFQRFLSEIGLQSS
jgi:hypothetical protein